MLLSHETLKMQGSEDTKNVDTESEIAENREAPGKCQQLRVVKLNPPAKPAKPLTVYSEMSHVWTHAHVDLVLEVIAPGWGS